MFSAVIIEVRVCFLLTFTFYPDNTGTHEVKKPNLHVFCTVGGNPHKHKGQLQTERPKLKPQDTQTPSVHAGGHCLMKQTEQNVCQK